MNPFTRSASSAAVLALAVTMSACGGDSSTPTPTATATPTPTPTSTPTPTPTGGTTTTAAIDCPYSGTYVGDYSGGGTLTSNWSWSCDGTNRTLTSTGLPAHPVGTFPNPGNPNTITAQSISASFTLTPTMGNGNTYIGGPGGVTVYTRQGVKFDPGTGGACPDSATQLSDCDLGNGTGQWRIEALSQDVFDFGADDNNAHVQPTGEYHYHGLPEGILTAEGVDSANPRMILIGWAQDGYPVYARYCYTDAMDAGSALKVCEGSFEVDTVADTGRPSVSLAPLGAFQSDWNYVAGSGDLDDCNGRTGVTPEFPDGIYYYMATDDYPFFSRCLKGNT